MSASIFEFMAEDHDRLDGLFRQFQSLNRQAPAARAKFMEFNEGLRRHIRWEEELLFPLYEGASELAKDGPTSVMRSEHLVILAILTVLGNDRSASASMRDRLMAVLSCHNIKEENILYPWIDYALPIKKRREILKKMRMDIDAGKKGRPLVYSCSGCSSAAQVANDVAIAMDRRGAAEMSCITGVGGDVEPLVKLAKSGRDIIVLDGCPLECAKHSLARHNVQPTHHYTLSKFGVRKRLHVDPDPKETERVLNEVMKEVSR